MKANAGYIFKKGDRWVARVTYTDKAGKRCELARYCPTKTEAINALKKLVAKIDDQSETGIEIGKLTFDAVAERYEKLKLIPPQYVGDVKVAGLRSMGPKYYIKPLRAYFGSRRIRRITSADIEAYKLERLATPFTRGAGPEAKQYPRSVASVNRELELLRAIFNFAKRQRWVVESPFAQGEVLINKAAERTRDRVLSYDEEQRLLDECVGPRAHLRPLVIGALDLGLRRGELFKLEWTDVDLKERVITLRAMTTKTARSRTVAMTQRLFRELTELWKKSGGAGASVFGIKDNVSSSFATACKKAGIEGVRFHDLRHTCVTRLIGAGVSTAEAMKISGHATLSMLSRYQNVDVEIAKRGASALDRHRGEQEKKAKRKKRG